MISVTNLGVHYGGEYLFEDVTFLINPRDRIGLTGKNGAGKSTLLKILAGNDSADEGTVSFPKEFTRGYLSQELNFNGSKTVLRETETAFAEIKNLEKHYAELTESVSHHANHQEKEYLDLLNDWHDAGHRLEILGIGTLESQMEKILLGLGFERTDFSRNVSEFSGGWQMRIELAKLLLQKPDLLLLDEPTNHLDIEAIIWLEEFLQDYAGAVVLVSHDRAFLDRVTNRTIEISNKKIEDYPCSYSKYVHLRKERRDHLLAQKKNQDKEIRQTEVLIEKFRYKASKAKFAQSLIKQLDRKERIEVDDEDASSIRFRFPEAERSGQVVFEAKHINKSFGNKNILQNISFEISRGDRIAFVGRNGEGKTTMAKIIVGEEEAKGELKPGYNVKIGFYAQHQADRLSGEETVFNTIDKIAPSEMSSRVRSLLGAFLFRGDDVDKKVKVLSGGEKSRLSLAKLLLEPVNFLVLDEPTNHLDMRSKEVLKEALNKYNGTLVVVSHDRDFLDGLVNKIYYFKNQSIKEYAGGVYEFLESQKSETFRDLELQKNSERNGKEVPKLISSEDTRQLQKDRKKLERQVTEAEKKISDLETSISHVELKISRPELLPAEETKEIYSHYTLYKQQLEKEMNRWSELSEQLQGIRK
ncbi:MAG: ABC-F family ATP-binding cassette domain-containing protein [Chitinophagales bacterium]|nr:ABC-F family ATP-binding cassette domain-containing protein [Chitinophagales bacterium]